MQAAAPLIERACVRHGGLDRWLATERIEGEIEHLGGLVPLGKGALRSKCRPVSIAVAPRLQRATVRFANHPEVTFDGGDLIEGTERYPAFRTSFSSLPRKLRPWGPRETAYFFGYALTHYLSLPFSLHPDVNSPSQPTIAGSGKRGALDWIDVEYAQGSDTHSRRERLWFDDSGLLKRHDYHAEIMGPGFWGAHHSHDYAELDGLLVARHRCVKLRFGSRSTPLTVLDARLKIDGSQ